MKEPFSEFKNLITATERYIQELSKSHGVEHLSGPQGWTVMFLKDNQGKEIFIKDIEKRLDISKSVTSNLIKRMEKKWFYFCYSFQKRQTIQANCFNAIRSGKSWKNNCFFNRS